MMRKGPHNVTAANSLTCAGCGAHEFTVVHEFTLVRTVNIEVPCTCGALSGPSTRTIVEKTFLRRWGPLDEDHGVEWEDEETDGTDTIVDETEIGCPPCYEAGIGDEDFVTIESDCEDPIRSDIDPNRFRVECDGCRREIEFGWSHPDRAGRIWPVEASDFNPMKSWPEPRFRDAWAERGWLRSAEVPTHEQHADASEDAGRSGREITERIQFLGAPGMKSAIERSVRELKDAGVKAPSGRNSPRRITEGYLLRELLHRKLRETVDELKAEAAG